MSTPTTPTTPRRTLAQRRTDSIYRVRELSERPAFDEEVARKTRQLRNHSNVELNTELPAWRNIYEESLNDGDAYLAMHALADIEAIGNVLSEREAW